MRIAQIAPPWLPVPPKQYGGAENVLYYLIEEQVAQGHDVTLFAPGDAKTSAKLVSFFPGSLIEDGISWAMHLKAYYHLHKAFEQIKEGGFDIVHTHLSSAADMYVFPLSASLHTPHLATLHSHFPFDRDVHSNKTGDADQYYMEWAPNVPTVAISENAREQEAKLVALNLIGVVHNGISLEQYRLLKRRKENHFAWLGRFSPEKGAHLAIEAAQRAGVPLVLAGTIDRYSKESMDYFRDVIKPHIGKNQVSYIGPANLKQKLRLFSSSRGFLNPIEWEEPFGMVMIESMSQGCPVITFARGAAPEIVADGVSGFVVKNLDEMVEKIADIEAIDRGQVREYVEQNFSARTMAEMYSEIYKQVIAMKRDASTSRPYPLVKFPSVISPRDMPERALPTRN